MNKKRGEKHMTQIVKFIESDEELIQQIKAFQKAQELPSFVAAVRLLCKNGLRMSDVVKNLK